MLYNLIKESHFRQNVTYAVAVE